MLFNIVLWGTVASPAPLVPTSMQTVWLCITRAVFLFFLPPQWSGVTQQGAPNYVADWRRNWLRSGSKPHLQDAPASLI